MEYKNPFVKLLFKGLKNNFHLLTQTTNRFRVGVRVSLVMSEN